MKLLTGIVSFALGASALATQIPFKVAPNFGSPKTNHTVSTLDLSSLSTTVFSRLSHPAYPGHSVRIKKSDFCDQTVKAYTGYIDVDHGSKHLFFYFFESRNNPDTDDVTMWINGGPGCSSSLGLLMELGPCRIADSTENSNGTAWNPYAWNTKTNLFFLDQPVGVGFSYSDIGNTVGTTEDAAKDVQAFVTIFFETFKKFQGRPFHMSGESYAGRYLPVFASEIVDGNVRAKEAGIAPINLKSVLIGNGMTDVLSMTESYVDIQCTNASIEPFQSISQCVQMRKALPKCREMMSKGCFDQVDALSCTAASMFCDQMISVPFFATGKNPYDISKPCEGKIEETLCYPVTKRINNYLDQPSVRELLGVDASLGPFQSCSGEVGQAFSQHMDMPRQTTYYVAELLERGIKVLIYVGTYDWICNHVGNYRWTSALEWSGHDAFNAESLREWKVDGRVAGMTKSANGLTFATVLGAGHMVPYDKPVEALALVNRWLGGDDL
ncbi:hypothetical protein BOTBODRAFT_146116 [Botryobasidium botryosum FD-172 SS1]|uniref:Carboxypeptidase n=1 Tax=Botryobasidium botryosum (strain FD-172 SS1) TaxID=930990 RepID=A0A067MPG1_BOTB1|nr:hypothetical protein BOTBODRAFT_146116 [Botryobasidium botryosum FD-172 SS1]